MAAHKWAAEIHAFADGQQIQSSRINKDNWLNDNNPQFNVEDLKFRIKPAEPKRARVETKMTATELCWEFDAGGRPGEKFHEELRRVANKAIQHALDAGQVVTREEFDRMCGDRKARDMAVAISVAKCVARQGGRYSYDDLAEAIAGAQR